MRTYDVEFYDQKLIPRKEGRYVSVEDHKIAVQALKLIALDMAKDPQKFAEGVLDDLNLR